MSQQQKGTSFIKDLVSRRDDKTRIVSCLPLDKPGSSGSKLTDSPFGVRFGYNQNTTSSSTQQQKLNSSRSVLGAFVEPRGVLAPPTLLLSNDEFLKKYVFCENDINDNINMKDLSWFFCPTNVELRDSNSFWQTDVDYLLNDDDDHDDEASQNKHHLPYALCYTGIQFGIQANQLGDGRLLTICETSSSKTSSKNNREKLSDELLFEIQIKGGGNRTPYSRGLDGLLTLQSALKEWLLSKMFSSSSLDIPVCEVLAVYKESGRECFRDAASGSGNAPAVKPNQFIEEKEINDDDADEKQIDDSSSSSLASAQPCGVLVRSCRSSIRVGTFDYLVKTQQWKLMQKLLWYLKRVHFSSTTSEEESKQEDSTPPMMKKKPTITDKFLVDLISQIATRAGKLVSKWQANGFCHGVLNTDNVLVIGDTIDLATGCFMHYFDDDFSQNPDDIANDGMYRFGRQPQKYFEAIERLGFLFYAFYASINSGDPDQNHVRILRSSLSRAAAEAFQSSFSENLNREILRKVGIEYRSSSSPLPELDEVAACIIRTLKTKKPAIDEFFEQVHISLVAAKNDDDRSRRRQREDVNDESFLQEIVEAFKKLSTENSFQLSSEICNNAARNIPNRASDSEEFAKLRDSSNDDEVVKTAFEKAFNSAFPKVHKSFSNNSKNGSKQDDCGCG